MQSAFVRKINKRGTSLGPAMPPEVLRFVGVREGDHVQFILHGSGLCEIRRADLAQLPDRVIEAAKPLETIHV